MKVLYRDAVRNLVDAGKEAQITVSLDQSETTDSFYQEAFGERLAEIISENGYPTEMEIPWSVEEFYLYSLEDLSERQVGYRYDASGDPAAGWDQGRYVIGDWAANPVSIDGSGVISYSRHGEGSWAYTPLLADIPELFNVLAAWIRYFSVQRGGNIFDDNFEITQNTREEISEAVLAGVDSNYKPVMMKFLLGEI